MVGYGAWVLLKRRAQPRLKVTFAEEEKL
jgi:hypothetical protein